MCKCISTTLISWVLMSLWFSAVSAQTFLFQSLPQDNAQVGLRYLRPFFEGDDDLTVLSGVYDLSVSIPVGSKFHLVGSLPFSTFDSGNGSGESDIGDIYVGLQIQRKPSDERSSVTSLGVFLPTAPSDGSEATFLGLFTNFYELQKYLPDVLTLYGNYAFRSSKPGGAIFGFEIGPNFLIPTEDGGDSELFLHYGLTAGFQMTQLAIIGEFAGIAVITEDVDDFGDRLTHVLAFGAQWTGNRLRPGIFYKLYLDEDLSDSVDGVLGIKLDVSLK